MIRWPSGRSTTGGPPANTTPASFTITEKCASAMRAAGKPAVGPIAAATTGTWPSRSAYGPLPPPPMPTARPECAERLVITLPPAASCRRTWGTRSCRDSASSCPIFAPPPPSEAPPRSVASSAPTTTSRPAILPTPITEFEGVNALIC